MSQPVSEISLYERIGGEPAVNAAVDRFYERALADPELKDFFNGVSMSRLKAQQFAFSLAGFGWPEAIQRSLHARRAFQAPIYPSDRNMQYGYVEFVYHWSLDRKGTK